MVSDSVTCLLPGKNMYVAHLSLFGLYSKEKSIDERLEPAADTEYETEKSVQRSAMPCFHQMSALNLSFHTRAPAGARSKNFSGDQRRKFENIEKNWPADWRRGIKRKCKI